VADVSSNEPSIRSLSGERPEKVQGPWYRSWPAVAGAAVVFVGAGLGLGLRTGALGAAVPHPQVEFSAPAAAPSPEATSAPPGSTEKAQTIRVTVRAEPPSATLAIDDGPAMPNPYVAEQAPSDTIHTIVARAPGYRERVESTAFDSTKEVVMVLSKEPVGHRPAAVVTKPEPSAPRSGDPLQLKKPPEKKPRVLDSDNPFKVP
jgi:hypothetical protein